MEEGWLPAHLGFGAFPLLLAAAGWGAFAYGIYADPPAGPHLPGRGDAGLAAREKFTNAFSQARAEADRARQALERAQPDLAGERSRPQLAVAQSASPNPPASGTPAPAAPPRAKSPAH